MLDNSKEVWSCSIKKHSVCFFSAPLRFKNALYYAAIKTPEGKEIPNLLYEFYNGNSFTLEQAKKIAKRIIFNNIAISSGKGGE